MVRFVTAGHQSATLPAVEGVAWAADRTACVIDGVQIPPAVPDGDAPVPLGTWTTTGTYYEPGQWPLLLGDLIEQAAAAHRDDLVALLGAVSDCAARAHRRRHPSRLALPPFPGHGIAALHASPERVRWELLGPAAVLWREAPGAGPVTVPSGVTCQRLPGGWVSVTDERWRLHAGEEFAGYRDALSRSADASEAHSRFAAALLRRRCVSGGFWMLGAPGGLPDGATVGGTVPAPCHVLVASNALARRLSDYAESGDDANPSIGFVGVDGFVEAFSDDPQRTLHAVRHDMETPFAPETRPGATSPMVNCDGPFSCALWPQTRHVAAS